MVRSEPIYSLPVSRSAGPPSSDPACINPPIDDCSFYANCLESRYDCGPSGYPLAYGQMFCNKFSADRSLLDSQGQQWMIDTMHCLQLALVPDAIGPETTCQALANQAYGTHAGCYVDSGLCILGVNDWSSIIQIVDIKTLFQNWEAFEATIETAVECVGFYAFMVLNGLFPPSNVTVI